MVEIIDEFEQITLRIQKTSKKIYEYGMSKQNYEAMKISQNYCGCSAETIDLTINMLIDIIDELAGVMMGLIDQLKGVL